MIFPYTKQNIGSPEIVGYSYISDKNVPEMKIYDPKAPNNYTIINPTFKKVLELIKIGDILAHSHMMLVMDFIKNKDDEIIDAICMQSATGIGRSRIETKIGKEQFKSSDGITYSPYLLYIYYNEKLNPSFDEGIKEGTIGLIKLSEYSIWADIADINKRSPEYTIFRFINKDSNGNAILNYKTFYPKLPNTFLNNDIIKLSDKNNDRRIYKHLYIEKLSNFNNKIVDLGNIIDYKIIIKNLSPYDYTQDLIVTEYLSKFVIFELDYKNKDIISFN